MTKKPLTGLFIILLTIGFIWIVPVIFPATSLLENEKSSFGRAAITLITGKSPVALNVATATTPEAMQLGMMHRRSWGNIDGMLFIFPTEEPREFWMKDTHLPLDIIFFDATGALAHMAPHTTPLSEEHIPSLLPARYVLELPAGMAQKLGLNHTTQLQLSGLVGQP